MLYESIALPLSYFGDSGPKEYAMPAGFQAARWSLYPDYRPILNRYRTTVGL